MQHEAHVSELLPAYALGALDEADADLVASHLASCTLCRAELGSFETVVEQLALSAPDESPSLDLKRRLMERVETLPPKNRARAEATRPPLLQRLMPVWAGASLILILALAATSLLLWQQANNLRVLTGPLGMQAIALSNNVDAAPQGSGFVIISADGQNGVLVVDALPELDPIQQYQAWLLRDGQTTRGPAFVVDETGYRGARIMAPDSLLSYDEILITIELIDGGGASPTGEQVLAGSLHDR
jgi:hypothetical protein